MANKENKKGISDFIKLFFMTAIGLFVAVVGYPLLHELGHSLATILFGGKVIELRLLPLPYVLCDSTGLSTLFISFIGLSGMALPFAISVFIHSKGYYLWFAGLILKGISLLSFCISIVAVFMYMSGHPISNEDVTQVISFQALSPWMVLGVVLVSAIICIFEIIKDHPIRQICNFFEI